MEDLEMEAITAARGANEERLGFCPRHVGMAKIFAFEWRIVNRMGTLCRAGTREVSGISMI